MTTSDRKESKEEEKVIIDNPGKGSCGFYAIAIGLIPALKQEIMEGKTEQPDSLFQKFLPPEILKPPVDEYRLAACKKALKEEIVCYEYKKSYNWPQEVLRSLRRRRTKGKEAMGLDPFLHRADKILREKLITHREEKINQILDQKNHSTRVEEIKNDAFLKEFIQVFNHYYCGVPGEMLVESLNVMQFEPLKKQIQQYALQCRQALPEGTQPPEIKQPGLDIAEKELNGLLSIICNPPQKDKRHSVVMETPAQLNPSSHYAKYIRHLSDIATYANDIDMSQLSTLLNVQILDGTRNLNKGVAHPVAKVVINFVAGFTSLTNHFNTQQSKKEFNEGKEQSALMKKFKKHVDFDKYPLLSQKEILEVAREMTTGRFSAVRTLFSNHEQRAFIAELKLMVKQSKHQQIMEMLSTREVPLGSHSSLINLGQKYLKMRQQEQLIHLQNTMKEPAPVADAKRLAAGLR